MSALANASSPVEESLTPPLKWAGGKRWLVPYLRPVWSRYSDRRLVEPFAGGLAMTLSLMPEEALLNDVSPYLINFYRWIREDGILSPERWQIGIPGFTLDGEQEQSDQVYYNARDRFNVLLKEARGRAGDEPQRLELDEEAAELFYYLNRAGFNGLCRFNSKGEYNVPKGAYKRIGFRTDFRDYQQAFARWQFRVGDFAELSAELRDDDFLYLDPPYDTPFTKYSPQDFKWSDQERLAEWASAHPGPVVISNQATARMVALYKGHGFRVLFRDAPRMISRSGDRTPAKEILAFHNVADAAIRRVPKQP